MKTHSTRGEITLGSLALIALVALVVGIAAPKPKFLDGRSREADKSAEVSAEVEKRVGEQLAANHKTAATVSASLNQMGVAASQLPDSPQKQFIVREGVWLSPLLPPPDPAALLAAERRRVAILEGKLELADKLYATANKERAALLARAAKAEAKADAAFASRRAMDGQLAESAAYQRGQQAVIGILAAIVVLVVILWILAKVNGFTPQTLGRMIADIRSGESADVVFDRYVPERLHRKVRHAASDAKT